MKPFLSKILLLSIVVLFSFGTYSQTNTTIDGVFEVEEQEGIFSRWILINGYCVFTKFQENKFMETFGGRYEIDSSGQLKINIEFGHPDNGIMQIGYDSKALKLTDDKGETWFKKKTLSQDLDGVWQMAGRMKEQVFIPINHSGSRKTLKILKDGCFQWIAFDEHQIYGTGGGEYEFKNGIYIEKIQFFSKDNKRVGAVLNFTGEIINKDWHHKGNSSKGVPIHEVWSLYKD